MRKLLDVRFAHFFVVDQLNKVIYSYLFSLSFKLYKVFLLYKTHLKLLQNNLLIA